MVHIRYSRWDASARRLAGPGVGVRSVERLHERHRRSAAGDAPADAEGASSRARSRPRASKICCRKSRKRDAQALRRVPAAVGDGRGPGAARLDRRSGAPDPRADGPSRARTFRTRNSFLNDLPGKTSEAVEKLTSYRFENANAEKEFRAAVDAARADPQAGKLAAPRGQFISRPNADGVPAVAGADGAHGGSAQARVPALQHAA